MKILKLKTAVVEGNFDWTFVRIETDEGLRGLGECFFAPGLTSILRSLEPLLLGEDPRDIHRLFRKLQLASSGAVFVLGFLKVGRESFGCVALRGLVILFDQFGNPVLEIGRLHDFTNMPCRNNDCDSRICAEPILFRRIWRGR